MGATVLVCGKVFDGASEELTGPAEILIEGNRIVSIGQSVNRPPGTQVIALAGYRRTYTFVEALLLDRVNKESPLQMHARPVKINQKPRAPTLNIEAIQEVAGDFARLTGAIEPRRIKPEGIKQLADNLMQLSEDIARRMRDKSK